MVFNEADMIERQMQKDGHRTWDYVIYRTTYLSDDADWSEFLRHLRLRREDAFLFDEADTPTIRAHFRQWAENAFRAEQQPSDGSGVEEVRMGYSLRYQFCVLVDPAALHSVVHDAPVATRDRRYQEGVGEAHRQDLDPPRGGPENSSETELLRAD
ncbi:hypothetical protein BDR22DRAFT_884324 [Usnea florida]